MTPREFQKASKSEFCLHPLNQGRGSPVKRIARAKIARGIWPAPVYEARMSDGELIRMSFFSPLGKPVELERGRRLILSCVPQKAPAWRRPVERGGLPWKSATIVYGAVHIDGKTIIDIDAISETLAA